MEVFYRGDSSSAYRRETKNFANFTFKSHLRQPSPTGRRRAENSDEEVAYERVMRQSPARHNHQQSTTARGRTHQHQQQPQPQQQQQHFDHTDNTQKLKSRLTKVEKEVESAAKQHNTLNSNAALIQSLTQTADALQSDLQKLVDNNEHVHEDTEVIRTRCHSMLDELQRVRREKKFTESYLDNEHKKHVELSARLHDLEVKFGPLKDQRDATLLERQALEAVNPTPKLEAAISIKVASVLNLGKESKELEEEQASKHALVANLTKETSLNNMVQQELCESLREQQLRIHSLRSHVQQAREVTELEQFLFEASGLSSTILYHSRQGGATCETFQWSNRAALMMNTNNSGGGGGATSSSRLEQLQRTPPKGY